MKTDILKICENCYYVGDSDEDANADGTPMLVCFRYPPTVVKCGSTFPLVENNGWCGEFQVQD